MEDISALIYGADTDKLKSPATAVEATVAEYVDAATGVYVTIPSFDAGQRFGPCRFVGPVPARGDKCLVVFDEQREGWVILPGVAGSSGGGGYYVYEQPTEPPIDSPVGAFWIDTDQPLPGAPIALPTLVWSYRVPDFSPVYGTPILTDIAGASPVVVVQSWDWYLYVLRLADGAVVWRKAFGDVNYGRAQAGDVTGDGHVEIFGASHDGMIWSLTDTGALRWRVANLYDREGNGTATALSGTRTLIDATKNWVPNSFQRVGADPTQNAVLAILSGTGAGQTRDISGVAPTTLTVSANWTTKPDATSVYQVQPRYESDVYWQHAGTLAKVGATWMLFACGFDGQCIAINADTGAIIWRVSSLESIEPFPLVMDVNGDGALECVFASVDGNLYCRSAATGAAVWTCTLGESPEGLDAFLNAADVDSDGVIEILVSGRTNRMHWVNGVTGAEKAHSTDTGADIDSRPALFSAAGGQRDVFSVGDSGYAYRYRPDGSTVWRTPVAVGIGANSSPAVYDVDHDGAEEAVVFDMAGGVTFLDSSGHVRGAMAAPGAVEGTPLLGDLDGDGKTELLLTTTDGYIRLYRWS